MLGEDRLYRKLRESSYGWECKVISTHPAGSQRNRDCPATDGNPSYPGYASWDNNDPDRNYKGRKHRVPCRRLLSPRSRSRTIRPHSWRSCRTTPRRYSIPARRASCTSTCNNWPWCATGTALSRHFVLFNPYLATSADDNMSLLAMVCVYVYIHMGYF